MVYNVGMSNQTGVISFHCGVGGNKNGLGAWMRALNAAAIPFPLKSTDQYGVLFEALLVGVEYDIDNILSYRMTKNDKGVREVPDYTASPLDAAIKHCIPLIQNLPPEFSRLVYIDIINEPRAKKAPGDVQYNDMNAMDWLGEFCYEAAIYMNGLGYRVIAPSLNSGEPGESTSAAVTEYSQPGMLKYIRYCADNRHNAMIGLHEYVWNDWKNDHDINDWYPHLFGRFEALIAAADIAGIPRTFRIMITEWGFGRDEAPLWNDALPHINDYSHVMSKFPQVVGTASWALQAGWGNVSNQVQTWIEPLKNYTINERPPLAPQPQRTHELFGSTLPNETEPPVSDLEQRVTDLEKIVLDHELRIQKLEGVPPVDPPNPPLLIIEANALGVDVSAHNEEFDWVTAIENGVVYGIVRSSNGLGSPSTDENGRDLWLRDNALNLTIMGVPWAVYHYLRPDHSISEQIELVYGILSELKGVGQYPRTAVLDDGTHHPTLYIDVERSDLTPAQIKQFYDGMIATGLHVGIYTRKTLWNPIMINEPVWWSNVSCWVAAYDGSNDGSVPSWQPFIPYGFHTNVLWQYTSKGGHVINKPGTPLDLNMATPFLATEPPPIDPPPVDTFDLLPYLRGADGWQLDIDATTYTQTLNTQHGAEDTWRLIKGGNGQYEYLYADDTWIYRREDTSQGNDKFYCHFTNGIQGAAWIKRHVAVGDSIQTQKEVVHYLNDCSIRQPSALVVDTIKVIGRYDKYAFSNGVSVDNVVELKWLEGDESYFFGLNRALVGFKDDSQDARFMGDLHGRQPLEYKKPPCIDEGERFYV